MGSHKPLSKCRIHIAYPIPGRRLKDKEWSSQRVEGWVKNAGGKVLPKFDESATHVVVDEAKWKNRVMVVQNDLDSGKKMHIVSPDWLEECLYEQKKSRERSFLWEVLDQAAEKEEKGRKKKGGSKNGAGEAEGEEGEVGSRAPQAMIGEVFVEATEPFLDEHARRALEAEAAGEEKARKEREDAEARVKEQERKVEMQTRKERQELMKKTAKKGRGEFFNKNYHIFVDGTNFAYDVMLTKVDTLTNTNERIGLTIYETNDKPHTYATNIHFAGTRKKPMHNILAVIGSSLTTATRTFRKAFRERTGVNWDDRIKAHNERVRARERDGDSPGLLNARRGKNDDVKSKTRADEDRVPFDKRKFEYMPPLHSARGWLPSGRDSVPEVVRQMRTSKKPEADADGSRERTELWMMSGGNGEEPREEAEQTSPAAQIDLTDGLPEGQLDVAEGVSGGDDLVSDPAGAGTVASTAAHPVHGGEDAAAAEDDTTQTFDLNNLLSGVNEFLTQDDFFDMGNLESGQQQPEFNFDQPYDNDFGASAGPTGLSGGDPFAAGQTDEVNVSDQHQGFTQVGDAVVQDVEAHSSGSHQDAQDAAASHSQDIESGGLGGLPLPFETQVGQTQLAAMVGEDLLNLKPGENAAGASAQGLEGGLDSLEDRSSYRTSTGSFADADMGAGKRKRDEADVAGGEDKAAKRLEAEFEGEAFAT